MAQSDITFTFLCPTFVTGGTEAIHQASMAFDRLGARSQIAYFGQGMQMTRHGDRITCLAVGPNVCLPAFAAYAPVVATHIDLDADNVLVVPEISALEYMNFQPARFVVWWLSVDNALIHNPGLADATTRSALFASDQVSHWFQSEYARRYLLACGARQVHRLTDFTDATFTEAPARGPNAGRKILYNRKKGADLAAAFFAANPTLEPLALDGLGRADLAAAYRANAIYVDFGSLPGKDRMPREAAACGCVVFVHCKGAGAEMGDFPFNDAFRFGTNDLASGQLTFLLNAVLANPRGFWEMQSHFREIVRQEETAFLQEAAWVLESYMEADGARVASGVPDALPVSRLPARRGAPPQAFAEGWEAARDRYCLWRVTPDNYVHVQAFDETMAALEEAFAALGGSAPVVHSFAEAGGRIPIVFGGHLLAEGSARELPPGTIIMNLEQVDSRSTWLNGAYMALLQSFAVLDYSARNAANLAARGITHVRYLSIGSMPGLRRITLAAERDIDVLFYGSLNERRRAVLEALQARGLVVEHLFGVYGPQRDAVIARAKIVLNMHYYESAIFEIIRVLYPLTNGCCVVTEGDAADPDLAPVREGMAICHYDSIVDTCVALAGDPGRRAGLTANAMRLTDALRQSDLLADLFADLAPQPARATALAS